MATQKKSLQSSSNKTSSKRDLSIFDLKVSPALMAQVVYVYQANTHQNTSKVKSRGEIKLSTRKIYRQKGTGGARHGSKSAPIFVGGGITHGPTGIRPKRKKLNQKMKNIALIGALSHLYQNQQLGLFIPPAKQLTKTKQVISSLPSSLTKKTINLIHYQDSPALLKTSSNLKNFTLLPANQINAFLVLKKSYTLLTPNSYDYLTDKFSHIINKKTK